MDGLQLSYELSELFRLFGARPIYVVRSNGSQRFVIAEVTIDIEAPGGPVLIVVKPHSDVRESG